MDLSIQDDTKIDLGNNIVPSRPSETVRWEGRFVEWNHQTIKPIDGLMTVLFLGSLVAVILGFVKIDSLSREAIAIGSVCAGFGVLVPSYYFYDQNFG